jgi:hypothetical protein
MSDQLELDRTLAEPELDLDAPAPTSPIALLAKPGALTGALVQRGRERAPRLMETSMPMEIAEPAAAPIELPVSETTPEPSAPLATPPRSRWTDVVFAAACCVAFFATFLFVLRF